MTRIASYPRRNIVFEHVVFKSHNTQLFVQLFAIIVGEDQLNLELSEQGFLIGSRQWLLQTVARKIADCVVALRRTFFLTKNAHWLIRTRCMNKFLVRTGQKPDLLKGVKMYAPQKKSCNFRLMIFINFIYTYKML